MATNPVVGSYNIATKSGKVRLLLNDVAAPFVFGDAEIAAFLSLEGDNIKRAAAQAIDSNASNEALASKVFTDSDGKSTNGASVADALRKHATALRAQADRDDTFAEQAADDGFFALVPGVAPPACDPELTRSDFWPYGTF